MIREFYHWMRTQRILERLVSAYLFGLYSLYGVGAAIYLTAVRAGTVKENYERFTYLFAWGVVLPTALLLAFFTVYIIQRRYVQRVERKRVYAALLAVNTALVLVALRMANDHFFTPRLGLWLLIYFPISNVVLINARSVLVRLGFAPDFRHGMRWLLTGIMLGAMGGGGLALLFPASQRHDLANHLTVLRALLYLAILLAPVLGWRWYRWTLVAFPVVMGIALIVFFMPYDLRSVVAAGLVLIALARWGTVGQSRLARLPGWLFDGLFAVVLFAVVINLNFIHDRHHFDFGYLASINDVLHGKVLFVDTNTSYGVSSIYFLAGIFKTGVLPLGYSGFSLLISVFCWLQFVLVYRLLRYVTQSTALAASAVAVMVIPYLYVGTWVPVRLPSTGPLRFGLIYPLLYLVMLRLRYPAHRRLFLALEFIFVSVATLWSIGVFTYITLIYLAIRSYEVLMTRHERRAQIVGIGQAIIFVGLAFLTALVIFEGYVRLATGQWPTWAIYFDFFKYYIRESPIYKALIPFWSWWFVLISLPYVSLAALLVAFLRGTDRANWPVYLIMWGISSAAPIQFAYYVTSSHWPSVHTIPAVFVLAFWLSQIDRSRLPVPIRRATVLTGGMIALTLVASLALTAAHYRLVSGTPAGVAAKSLVQVAQGKDLTALDNVQAHWDGWHKGIVYDYHLHWDFDPKVPETVNLIRQFSPDDERIALFARLETTQCLLLVDKTQIFPISEPELERYSPIMRQRAYEFDHPLRVGDVIYVKADLQMIHETAGRPLVEKLCGEFDFNRLVLAPFDLTVLELVPQATPDENCQSDLVRCVAFTEDFGTEYESVQLAGDWSPRTMWDGVTVRWAGSTSELNMLSCLGEYERPERHMVRLTLRIYNPLDASWTLNGQLADAEFEIMLEPGWGDYTVSVSVITTRVLPLKLDHQASLELADDGDQLSVAYDWIRLEDAGAQP